MTVLIITFFIIGLAFGSFLNCLVYRLAHKKTILGRSFCPHCRHQLKWKENIPVFSFVFLKGRCHYCQKKISWQNPLIELITGFLFLLPLRNIVFQGDFLFTLPLVLRILIDWLVYFGLVFIFIYDLKYMLVEDKVVLLIIVLMFALSLLVFLLNNKPFFYQFNRLIVAMFLGAGFFALQYLITKGKGIGQGDVIIGFFMGLVLGNWINLCLAIFISYLIGSLISLGLIILKKQGFKSQVPLGPFLVLGTFIAYIWGEQIINWYLHWS